MFTKKNILYSLLALVVLGFVLSRWAVPLPIVPITIIPADPVGPDIFCTQSFTYKALFGWPFNILFVGGRNGCDNPLKLSILALVLNLFLYLKITKIFTRKIS